MNNLIKKKLLLLFLPLSILIRLIYRIRRYLYLTNYYESYSFKPRTISVGNLVMGGSGKTPMMKWIINNLNPDDQLLISSRGYKSKYENVGITVYPEDIARADEIGDENCELLSEMSSGAIAVGKNRVKQIIESIKNNHFNYLLLDDGFQHLKVRRDLNIVLFNSSLDVDMLRVFPVGYLREGLSSLFEADLIILTNCKDNISENEKKLRQLITPYMSEFARVYRSKINLYKIVNMRSGEIYQDVKEEKFVLVSGIANPEKFKFLMENNGAVIQEHLYFPDHHYFSTKDYEKIEDLAKRLNCPILMTQKDAVKFNAEKVDVGCYYCVVGPTFFGNEREIINIIKERN